MTVSAVVHTSFIRSEDAGTSLGAQVRALFGGARPDAVLLFATPRYDFPRLLSAIDAACRPHLLVGSSSVGEFTREHRTESLACAVALKASEMRFSACVGRRLSHDRLAAARALVSAFEGMTRRDFAYRSALILTDGRAGHTEDLLEHFNVLTGGTYQLFGGAAGGESLVSPSVVFRGLEAIPDAVVALEILSNKPIGIGVGHGFTPCSDPLRVTDARGTRLGSLNAVPAADVFEEFAEKTGQRFDRNDALPFFLHNVIGVDTGRGHKLRVPLRVNHDGSIACATEVPAGSTVQLMNVAPAAAAHAAEDGTHLALCQLHGLRPSLALYFDCVAARQRLGGDFGFKLSALRRTLGCGKLAGFNTTGQLARADGQLNGFHNCTAVVCVIPE